MWATSDASIAQQKVQKFISHAFDVQLVYVYGIWYTLELMELFGFKMKQTDLNINSWPGKWLSSKRACHTSSQERKECFTDVGRTAVSQCSVAKTVNRKVERIFHENGYSPLSPLFYWSKNYWDGSMDMEIPWWNTIDWRCIQEEITWYLNTMQSFKDWN